MPPDPHAPAADHPASNHPGTDPADPTPVGAGPSPERVGRVKAWLTVVVVALVVAVTVRVFVAEAFRIPTASMERSLLIGDFLLVSKLHYGPRTPITLGLPFSDRYLPITLPSGRLPGFSDVERGDVIVFNHPTERAPVDRRTHFIKRVVGLPGDTVAVVGKEVRANGEALPLEEGMQIDWLVTSGPGASDLLGRLREIGVQRVVREGERGGGGVWRVRMTMDEAERVATWEPVRDLRPAVSDRAEALFPFGRHQTIDDYGPVVVPKRGAMVQLTPETWPVVRDVIERYEGHAARRFADGRYEIDGALTSTYTFEQDYYFVMGDNRDDSSDSRRWGFVPRDHLVGKAVLVYFSWDARDGRPRFERFFHPIR